MASPEPGTIVRLKGINNFNVEFNPPAWGVIVDDGDNSFGCRPCATILIFNGAENFLGSERNSLGWWFYDNEIDVIPVAVRRCSLNTSACSWRRCSTARP
jgi:hypothetical protein